LQSPASPPRILLLHDQELGDVHQVLDQIGLPFVERIGKPTELDRHTRWDIIIASQMRMGTFSLTDATRPSVRMAVIDNDSRTLRSMLQRLGVEFVVARPVHATALRLLILHVAYRGPERRREARASIGAEVQYRSGLRKRRAVLAELSLRGCRLVTPSALATGKAVKIQLPGQLAEHKPFSISGRVVRSHLAGDGEGEHMVAVAFHGLSEAQGQQLRRIYECHASGPARSNDSTADAYAADSEGIPAERRTAPRHEFHEHIIALGHEAARVLLCRDISRGGMRVEANETLVAGDDLEVALHARTHSEPMVLDARVSRDDGEKGLVLTFENLTNETAGALQELAEALPLLARRAKGEETAEPEVFVSEIVERRAS
jgi:hypothetical protein